MARRPDALIGLVLAASAPLALADPARETPARETPARETPAEKTSLSASEFAKRKEPITVNSDMLEYDYKANVVVYRGDVQAVQGPVKVRSDTLTVTLESDGDKPGTDKSGSDKAGADKNGTDKAGGIDALSGSRRLRQILAAGNVRIDHGTRWATGGQAVFDQGARTIVLTKDPVLHDGNNEVMGDRVVVYLDEDRSVVEGGRKRVKAVLYPNKNEGLAPQGKDGKEPAPDASTAASTTQGSRR